MDDIKNLNSIAEIRYELKRKQRHIKMLETQYQNYKHYMWWMLGVQTVVFSIIIFGLAVYVFSRQAWPTFVRMKTGLAHF